MNKILVVNDDGIDSEYLHFLATALMKYGEVTVCAPITQKSAFSHAIDFYDYKESNMVKDKRFPYPTFKIKGTPADCVRYACDFLDTDFDYVFSGINKGYNIGIDIYYSGTVGAAVEGTLRGIKSVALSAHYNDFNSCSRSLDDVLAYIFDNNLADMNYTLNVNIPKDLIKPLTFKLVKQAGVSLVSQMNDKEALKYGYIAVTPLCIDRTDYMVLEKFKITLKNDE